MSNKQFIVSCKLKENVRCPVCATNVDFDAVVCPRCSSPHHRECWEYVGGCAIFGCDEQRWRPMSPVATAADIDAVCARTEDWLTLFRYHWTTFVIVGIGIVTTLTSHAANALFYAIFPPTTAMLRGMAMVTTYSEIFFFTTAAVGLLAYFALAVPAYLRQRSLEKVMGQALPQPSRSPDAVAERLELPAFGSGVLYMYKILGAILTGITGLAFATIVLSTLSGNTIGVFSFLLLLFLRVVLIPWFHMATRSRVELLVSAQNRMLASFKDGKVGK